MATESKEAAWASPCFCCQSFPFDPVPAAPATPARRPGTIKLRSQHAWVPSTPPAPGLQAAACSSTAAASGTAAERATRPRRNVLSKGLARFDSGLEAPEQADWEQLSGRVICVLGQNPSQYTLNGTNCYLVGTGRRRVLIDAGEEYFGSEAFLENLAQCMKEHSVEGLEALIITHWHHDHYGNTRKLQAQYGPLTVYARIMEGSSTLLDGARAHGLLPQLLGEDGQPRFNPTSPGPPPPLPEGLDLAWADEEVQGFPGSSTGERLQYIFYFIWRAHDLQQALRQGEIPWRQLEDGATICTEGATLTVLHAPGHAPDHTAFVLEEEHSLFSGDHVLGWGTTLVTDMKEYMATLRRMLAMQPLRLYPGHGALIEDGVEMLARYITHRERREKQAWEALKRKTHPVSVLEVARELYPDTPEERIWMARDNVERLFRKFAEDGAASAWRWEESHGGLKLVPYKVPGSYQQRRLRDDVLWAAKRSFRAKI